MNEALASSCAHPPQMKRNKSSSTARALLLNNPSLCENNKLVTGRSTVGSAQGWGS